MRKIGIGLRIILGLAFSASAIGKFTGGADAMRDQLELAPWFWMLVGVIELAGGVALLLSLRINRLALPVGLLFVGTMAGAVVSHIRVDDPLSTMVAPLALLILAAIVSGIALQEDDELRYGIAERITPRRACREWRHSDV